MEYRQCQKKFEGFPYVFERVGSEFLTYYEVRRWCSDEFGLTQQDLHYYEIENSNYRWSFDLLYMVFRDENDAFWFKLRWC